MKYLLNSCRTVQLDYWVQSFTVKNHFISFHSCTYFDCFHLGRLNKSICNENKQNHAKISAEHATSTTDHPIDTKGLVGWLAGWHGCDMWTSKLSAFCLRHHHHLSIVLLVVFNCCCCFFFFYRCYWSCSFVPLHCYLLYCRL